MEGQSIAHHEKFVEATQHHIYAAAAIWRNPLSLQKAIITRQKDYCFEYMDSEYKIPDHNSVLERERKN